MSLKQKILATADGHIERLEENDIQNALKYIKESFAITEPNMFVYAGDAADSRNVRAESVEYKNLTKYMVALNEECKKRNIPFIYVKGTPSHDGDVIKRIIEINELEVQYYEEPKVTWFKGISFLWLPEMYTPTLESFYDLMDEVTGKKKVDIIVYHGMFDFAIPQLKQIDSAFNQSRSVVIDTDRFLNKYVNIMAFGGHVHRAINYFNCFYLGRFVNERHQDPDSDLFGFKLITVDDGKYTIKNVENPYLLRYKFVEIRITRNTTIDELNIKMSKLKVDQDKTVFKLFIDKNRESRHTFSLWKKIYKPKYMKKKFLIEDIKNLDTTEDVSTVSSVTIDKEDIENMIKHFYKKEQNEELPEEILNGLFMEVE